MTLIHSEHGQIGISGSLFYYGWNPTNNRDEVSLFISKPYNDFYAGMIPLFQEALVGPQPPIDVPKPRRTDFLVRLTTDESPDQFGVTQGSGFWWEEWVSNYNGQPFQDGNDDIFFPYEGDVALSSGNFGRTVTFGFSQYVDQVWEPGYVSWSFPTTTLAMESFKGDPGGLFGMNYSLQIFDVSPIPEPAEWAMMLLGFGAIGRVLRRSPKLLRHA